MLQLTSLRAGDRPARGCDQPRLCRRTRALQERDALNAEIGKFTERSGGVPWRYPDEIRPVLATMQYDPASNARAYKCWLTATSPFEDFNPESGIGATLIWGDSHAGRLYTGLKQDGNDVAQFVRDGCVPSLGSDNEACARSNAAILRKIAELKPKKVILFAAWATYKDYDSGDVRNSGPTPLWSPDAD